MRYFKFALIFLAIIIINLTSKEVNKVPNVHYTFVVTVLDSSNSQPLQSARVALIKHQTVIETQITNVTGRAIFNDVDNGQYVLKVFLEGYRLYVDSVNITDTNSGYTATIKELFTQTEEITIVADREQNVSSIDVKTGEQVFESSLFHETPSLRITQVVQENLAGAVKAPTGEVHINGEHGEFTYYVDGIPIPLGVFGGLNEVVDPQVIDKATFITGGYPAEYGGQIAGIIDITNRVPGGKFHLDFSSYIGSYLVFNGTKMFSPGNEVYSRKSSSVPGDTLGGRIGPLRSINSNGQSLSFSDNLKNFSFFLSGTRQETDRRIDQPVVTLFNDKGTDYFLFGKFDYVLNKTDYITANLNYSRTNTQVPFDSSAQGYSPDNQVTTNSFQSISYIHTISEKKNRESSLFIGLFARQGSLLYTPSPVSPVNFQFSGDSTLYALTTDRSFNSYGIRTKYNFRFSKTFNSYAGFNFNSTYGKENFTSRDSSGNPGPSVSTKYSGSDFGVFAQGEWHPSYLFKLDLGVRYDQHIAPDVSLQKQFSPRIKFNFFTDEYSSLYLFYGKLFMPTNVEGLKTLATNVSNSNIPTIPERSDFYEFSYSRNFRFGLNAKFEAFYKYSSPGIDDQTIGASAIKTPVNIEHVHTTGIELALSYHHPKIPISCYINTSLIHAYGSGVVTGGFLNVTDDGTATDLDHDQRLSITSGINYQPKNWFVNISSIYGSGLTNGNPNNISYGTGIFDFNKGAHVPPYITFNLSGGYTFQLKGNMTIEPSLYITNLFDKSHLIKGAYFSAASYGERRNVTFKLAYHI